MLLWLTLAVLWSTTCTCWAGQMFGYGGGWHFSTSPDYENDISGIRVSISRIGIFKSIQVRHGSSWSEALGVSGGNSQELLLWPGEHIVGAYGSYKIYLRYLILYTDFGRWVTFGKEDGRSFIVYPDQPGDVVTGLFGQYGALGITGIGFQWDYPREQAPTGEQAPTEPPQNTTSKN